MVEATPSSTSPGRLAELEECIFETIDEEMRGTHDWCKDLVLEYTQRIETISRKHLGIAKQKLSLIHTSLKNFKEMAQMGANEAMKARLLEILQSEKNREGVLVGAEADFCNEDGQVSLPRVLKAL